MKKTSILISLIMLLCGATGAYGADFFPTMIYSFQAQSPLAEGKWVKVEVTNTGIQAISYESLRAMGFSDPSKVSVYGGGSKSYNPSVGDARGNRNFNDIADQVPVYYHGDKLYFYGTGPRTANFSGSTFSRVAPNIYNANGVYLLTDTGSPLLMETETVSVAEQAGAVLMQKGHDYMLHETDKLQGFYNLGQEFWEQDLYDINGQRQEWTMGLSNVDPNRGAKLTFGIATGVNENGARGSFTLGINDTYKSFLANTGGNGTFQYVLTQDMNGDPICIKEDGMINVSILPSLPNQFTSDGTVQYVACLDYWILSYPKDVNRLTPDFVQERLGLESESASTAAGCVPVPASNALVFDVKAPNAPKVLTVEQGKAWMQRADTFHSLIMVNPAKEQRTVSNATEVPHTNLHAMQNEKIDLLIVTVPQYRKQAEEIAELHRQSDGIGVLVADIRDIYNEFTAGAADPVAIRMLAKMLYGNGRKENPLKNVLLLGPTRADVRNVRGVPYPEYIIPTPQQSGLVYKEEPAPIFDFYGIADDVANTNRLHEIPMNMGVGTLPVSTQAEANMAVDKIREYLRNIESTDFAWIANEYMSFSHSGDSHIHDQQASQIGTTFESIASTVKSGKFAFTTMYQDFFPGDKYTSSLTGELNDGKLLSVYFGHANLSTLGNPGYEFFKTANFISLSNKMPSFMFFAGCDLAKPDDGLGGIGQASVLNTSRALIGSICSTRQVWSNWNMRLAQGFTRKLFLHNPTDTSSEKAREYPTTVGNALAEAKNSLSTSDAGNKLRYLLIGDPAIIVPVPLRNVAATVANNKSEGFCGGETLVLNGSVRRYNQGDDASYNGGVVVKVCAPAYNIEKAVLQDTTKTKMPVIAERIIAVKGDVTDGKFTVRIPLPKDIDAYRGINGTESGDLQLYVSTYDPEKRMSGTGYTTVKLRASGKNPVPSEYDDPDVQAPHTLLTFNEGSQLLKLSVSDDCGLLPGVGVSRGTRLTIDGKNVEIGSDSDFDEAGIRNYSTIIPVSRLDEGNHKAVFSSVDLAGNRSAEQSLSFSVDRTPMAVGIEAPEYTTGETQIKITAKSFDSLELYVLDADGQEVFTKPLDTTTADWDATGSEPGIYTIGVRSSNGRHLDSRFVKITVIE